MSAPKKIDSYAYNELVSGAYEDAKDFFLEEPLGYWYSAKVDCEASRVDADAWARNIHAAMGTTLRATEEEWEIYKSHFEDAIRFVVKYVETHWDPDCEDNDHYENICAEVEAQLEEGDLKVGKPDPRDALLRACRLILAIEENPEQNPEETVKLAPKTREQLVRAVRAAGYPARRQ